MEIEITCSAAESLIHNNIVSLINEEYSTTVVEILVAWVLSYQYLLVAVWLPKKGLRLCSLEILVVERQCIVYTGLAEPVAHLLYLTWSGIDIGTTVWEEVLAIEPEIESTVVWLAMPFALRSCLYHHHGTHLNQVREKLKDEHLSKHETATMIKDKPVRIIAISDVSHELSNQEIDSWIKLIRVLTHEIMNTITPVTSLSETLLKELEEDMHWEGRFATCPNFPKEKDLRIGLETIHKTGTELLSFVNNYRRFTHVPQPQPSLFYVEPFLNRMAMLCNHEVSIEVSPKDLIVYADESLIAHVVTNLLKNAVEAIKEKESTEVSEDKHAFIRIKAYANEQEAIVIDVTNNAGIIPDDIAAHIFIPFFTTKKEGSGIGLSLSRQIMRVSGGTLSLHQDKEENTTTFRIVIP